MYEHVQKVFKCLKIGVIDLFKKRINECVDEVLMDELRQTWCQEKSSAIGRDL